MTPKIIKYPADILRQKAKKVKNANDPEIQKIIAGLTDKMNKVSGLGLAAPQVGESLQICLVLEIEDMSQIGKNAVIHAMINPKITAFSKNKAVMEEGCLSFPGKYFSIRRPESVKVRYLDDQGKKCKIKAKGIFARTIQHEVDHLDGILLIDRVK